MGGAWGSVWRWGRAGVFLGVRATLHAVMPVGLRVFLLSLLFGALGGYAAFRVGFWLAMRFVGGEYRDVIAIGVAVLSALLVGCASAVTAGVLAGRATRA